MVEDRDAPMVVRRRSVSGARAADGEPPDWKTLLFEKGLVSSSRLIATGVAALSLVLVLDVELRFGVGSVSSITVSTVRACFPETVRGTLSGGAVLCLVDRGVGSTSCASSVLALVVRLLDRVDAGVGGISSLSPAPVPFRPVVISSMPLLVRFTRALAVRILRAWGTTSVLNSSISCDFLAEEG